MSRRGKRIVCDQRPSVRHSMAPSRVSHSPPATPSTLDQGLSQAQRAQFERDGFLCIEDALDQPTVRSLLKETHDLLNSFDPSTHPMTQFVTGDGQTDNNSHHVGDDYFLTSGDKVRYFLEPDAVSPSQPDKLLKPPHLSVNKIGHALHDLSPAFARASINERNAAVARSLGFRNPRVLQSMVILKQPEIGGAVPPHQDSTFLYTDPPSAVGFWYALEDATGVNGGLSFAKGSHLRHGVGKRYVRSRGGTGTEFEDVDGARFPKGIDRALAGREREEEYEMAEVKAGTLVLIHGNMLHKSEKNTSAKSRFIYTFHMIEGECKYDERNWLQPTRKNGFSSLYRGRD